MFGSSSDPVVLDGAYVSDGESLRVIDQIFETLVTTNRIVLAGEHASYYGGWQEGGITSSIDAITRLHQRVQAG